MVMLGLVSTVMLTISCESVPAPHSPSCTWPILRQPVHPPRPFFCCCWFFLNSFFAAADAFFRPGKTPLGSQRLRALVVAFFAGLWLLIARDPLSWVTEGDCGPAGMPPHAVEW